jgi:hypothetical protein
LPSQRFLVGAGGFRGALTPIDGFVFVDGFGKV